MSRPVILRTPKKRLWLVLEADGSYRPIAPRRLRMRLRELGLARLCAGLKGPLRPSEIADRHGARVTPSIFAAAERGAVNALERRAGQQ